jgi:hypothetical protein
MTTNRETRLEKKLGLERTGIRELNPEDEYLGRRLSEQRLTKDDSDEIVMNASACYPSNTATLYPVALDFSP